MAKELHGYTVVYRFSGLQFSGLSRFSGLFLLPAWQQKWSNHIIGMILFSGLSQFSGPFCGDGQSPLNRDTTVFSCGKLLPHIS